MSPKDKIHLITEAAWDKKADDVVILKMKRLSHICDYFIITSGTSTRQTRAISDNIEDQTRRKGIIPLHIEGYNEGKWILLDYYDIVVHIFIQEARAFYNLERLWLDAPRMNPEDYGR